MKKTVKDIEIKGRKALVRCDFNVPLKDGVITDENRLPFGRMIGLGTIICGVSIAIFGCLSFVAEKTQIDIFTIIGAVIVVVGLVIGLALSLYAMIKYNKGIF